MHSLLSSAVSPMADGCLGGLVKAKPRMRARSQAEQIRPACLTRCSSFQVLILGCALPRSDQGWGGRGGGLIFGGHCSRWCSIHLERIWRGGLRRFSTADSAPPHLSLAPPRPTPPCPTRLQLASCDRWALILKRYFFSSATSCGHH